MRLTVSLPYACELVSIVRRHRRHYREIVVGDGVRDARIWMHYVESSRPVGISDAI